MKYKPNEKIEGCINNPPICLKCEYCKNETINTKLGKFSITNVCKKKNKIIDLTQIKECEDYKETK